MNVDSPMSAQKTHQVWTSATNLDEKRAWCFANAGGTWWGCLPHQHQQLFEFKDEQVAFMFMMKYGKDDAKV